MTVVNSAAIIVHVVLVWNILLVECTHRVLAAKSPFPDEERRGLISHGANEIRTLGKTIKARSLKGTSSIVPDFNLTSCETYEIQWAKDLRESCASKSGCRCFSAERLILSGGIRCKAGALVDQCPDGCEVCQRCLGDTLAGNHCKKKQSYYLSQSIKSGKGSTQKGKGSAKKKGRTQIPSFQPSLDPSRTPSIFPTIYPSPYPSPLPSSFPSEIPSISPSLEGSRRFLICPSSDWPVKKGTDRRLKNSKKTSNPSSSPSSVPSYHPSYHPSLLPSTSPSSVPTFAPSSKPSSSPSYFPSLSSVTVKQVKNAIKTINDEIVDSGIFPPDTKIFVEEIATAIGLSTLALSKTFEIGSEARISQHLIIDDLNELANALKTVGTKRAEYFYNITTTYFANEVPDYLIEIMERIDSMKADYSNFLDSFKDNEKAVRDEYTSRFRQSCNVPHFSPEDIFRYLYGFACGNQEGNSPSQPCVDDYGTCSYGSKNRLHFEEAAPEALEGFGNFYKRIVTETIALQLICLPINIDTCTDAFSIVDKSTLVELNMGLREVSNNLDIAKECRKEDEKEIDDKGAIALCVVDSRGYPIPPSSPEYDSGTQVYSSTGIFTIQTVGDIGSDNGSLKEITETFANFVDKAGGLFKETAGLSKTLKVAGVVLSLISLFLPDPPDPVIMLLEKEFAQLNEKLDALDEKISDEFNLLRASMANDLLDREMAILQRIKVAYLQYTDLPNYRKYENFLTLKDRYTENFRYACNFLDFTPADIIRNLYGHACGDADFGSLCVQGENNKFDWGSTGECQYGFKKQGYLFQAMWEEAEDVTQFRLFANVLRGAMSEALFLQSVCLPPETGSCPTDNDPIFKMSLSNSVNALAEVNSNLKEAEDCRCPCKVLQFESFRIPPDGFRGFFDPAPSDADFVKLTGSLSLREETNVPAQSFTVVDLGRRGERVQANTDISFTRFSSAKRYIYFDGKQAKLQKGFPEGAKALPLSIIKSLFLRIEEYDLNSGNEVYDRTIQRDELKGDDTCITSSVDLSLGSDSQVKVNIIPATPENGLRCSVGFCSDEVPDCPLYEFCNKSTFSCEKMKKIGEGCSDGSPCLNQSSGFTCQDVNGEKKCARKCNNDNDCPEETYCDDTENDTCQIRKNENEECKSDSSNENQCNDGLFCNNISKKCMKFLGAGDECSVGQDKRCEPGLQCKSAGGNSSNPPPPPTCSK